MSKRCKYLLAWVKVWPACRPHSKTSTWPLALQRSRALGHMTSQQEALKCNQKSNAYGGRVRPACRLFMCLLLFPDVDGGKWAHILLLGPLDLCETRWVTGAPRGPSFPRGRPSSHSQACRLQKKKKIFLATAIFHYLTRLLQKQYHQSALTSEEGVVFWKCKHPRKPAWEQRTLSAECRPVSQQYPTRIVPSVSDCRANTSAGATKCSTRPVNKIQVEVTCKEWTNSNNPFYCVAILSHEDALQTGASARRETEVMWNS